MKHCPAPRDDGHWHCLAVPPGRGTSDRTLQRSTSSGWHRLSGDSRLFRHKQPHDAHARHNTYEHQSFGKHDHWSTDSRPVWIIVILLRQKISPQLFANKNADNMSNKCTFSNTNFARYKVLVTFQQLTEVDRKGWTSDKINVFSSNKERVSCTIHMLRSQSNIPNHTDSLHFTRLFCDFSLIPAELPDISRNSSKVAMLHMGQWEGWMGGAGWPAV